MTIRYHPDPPGTFSWWLSVGFSSLLAGAFSNRVVLHFRPETKPELGLGILLGAAGLQLTRCLIERWIDLRRPGKEEELTVPSELATLVEAKVAQGHRIGAISHVRSALRCSIGAADAVVKEVLRSKGS